MSSKDFSVDLSRVYRPPVDISSIERAPAAYKKKESERFFYIQSANQWLEAYRTTGRRWERFYNVVSKVAAVFMALLAAFIHISAYYFPLWVPLGIALPVILLVAYARGKLKLEEKAEDIKRDTQFVPLLNEFLKERSFKSLHPIGEWDLPAVDERLKSDVVMKKTLEKRHPQSGQHIEEVMGFRSREKRAVYDLEVSPFVQQYVACRFAHWTKDDQKWSAIKEARKEEARGCFREATAQATQEGREFLSEEDLEKFQQVDKRAFGLAYGMWYETRHKKMPVQDVDFPDRKPRTKVESLIGMYQTFVLKLPKVEKLVKEGEDLYALYPFLDETVRTFSLWPVFLAQAEEIKLKQIDPLVKLLEKSNPPATDGEILCALNKNLFFELYGLLDEMLQIEGELKTWIGQHPQKRLAVFEEKMKEFDEKTVLSRAQLKDLARWIQSHPESCEKKCVELTEGSGFPKEVRSWFEVHPDFRFLKPRTLFDRAYTMREKLDEVLKDFRMLQIDLFKINSGEEYADYCEALKTFAKEILPPFDLLMLKQGQTSTLKIWWGAMKAKHQAVPFAKEPIPLGPPRTLREGRKIHELRLNELLKQVDSKMVCTNRIRGTVLALSVLLVVVELIFLANISYAWIIWAMAGLNLASQAGVYYLENRLRQLDKQKQGVKLQQFLFDHPDIGAIPGTRPRLTAVKQVQQKYGLEGVGATWGRALTEGNEVIAAPQDLRSARKTIKKMATEGSKQAARYLEDQLIALKSRSQSVEPLSNEGREIKKRISSFEKTLKNDSPPKEYPAPQVSDYEKYARARKQVEEKHWDKVGNKITSLNKKKNHYKQVSELFETLAREIENGEKQKVIWACQLNFIQATMKGDKEAIIGIMDAVAKLDSTLDEDKLLVPLQASIRKLQTLPREQLLEYDNRIQEEKNNFERAQRMLERLCVDVEYQSKERLDDKIEKKIEKLENLEEERALWEQRYNELSAQMDKARPAAAPVEPTLLEQLAKQLKAQKMDGDAICTLYLHLGVREQSSIWWQLPQAVRELLSGDRLLALCWSTNPIETKAIEKLFAQIEPKRQTDVYHALPPAIKESLKKLNQQLTGEDLTTFIRELEQECRRYHKNIRAAKRKELWEGNKERFISRFVGLDLYHQDTIYRSLPHKVRALLNPAYEIFSGAHFLADCQNVSNKMLPAQGREERLVKWWEENKEAVLKNWKQVHPRHQIRIYPLLPSAIRQKLTIA